MINIFHRLRANSMLSILVLAMAASSFGQTAAADVPPTTNPPSMFRSADDGWLDLSSFLKVQVGSAWARP